MLRIKKKKKTYLVVTWPGMEPRLSWLLCLLALNVTAFIHLAPVHRSNTMKACCESLEMIECVV